MANFQNLALIGARSTAAPVDQSQSEPEDHHNSVIDGVDMAVLEITIAAVPQSRGTVGWTGEFK